MVQKKIAQNQGESGRINLSGSELEKFGAEVGEEVEVEVAESEAIAKAMIESRQYNSYVIISKSSDDSGVDVE